MRAAVSPNLMSTPSETELDLESLLLPAWAKESPQVNRYANFRGEPHLPGMDLLTRYPGA